MKREDVQLQGCTSSFLQPGNGDPAMTHPRLRLPEHVFVCMSGDHCIFLDLRRDEYSCLPRPATAGFDSFVEGWPAGTDGEKASAENGAAKELLGELTSAGLLEPAMATLCPSVALSLCPPSASLLEWKAGTAKVGMDSRDAARFLTCATTAVLRLRWRSIEAIVRAVRNRKRRNGGAATKPDLSRLRELALRFDALRPWFPKERCCLFDSLALIEFLARDGHFPDWVFAVRSDPFHAHCWVQSGELLLNDSLEHVLPFTPIMAV